MALDISSSFGFVPCPTERWQELCEADTTSTFYQTPDWLEVVAQYLKREASKSTATRAEQAFATTEVAPWHFRTDSFEAVLPLLRRRRLGSWHYFSPFGTYTALVATHSLAPENRHKITRALAKTNLLLTSSPFTGNAVQVGKALNHSIQVVDLTQIDPDNPMRDWEEGQQRRVRVSLRSGVTLRKAQSQADWKAYDALYRGSLARWGDATTQAYGESLFDALRKRLEHSPKMALWVAEIPAQAARDAGQPCDSEAPVIAAGYLTFYHQGHVVPWHGAGNKAFFRYGVTQALFHQMISHATRAGYRHFDLTGSSGLQGVAAFKSRFGTQDLAFQGSLNQVGWYGLFAGANRLWHSWRQATKKTPALTNPPTAEAETTRET